MKRSRSGNPIARLVESCDAAVDAAHRQGKRNKLSESDKRYLSLVCKRNTAAGTPTTLHTLAAAANAGRSGSNVVGTTTIHNHLAELNVGYRASFARIPKEITPARLPSWLRARRGFCAQMKKVNIWELVVADETFFGLKAKHNQYKKIMQPAGAERESAYTAQYAKHRVSVWAGVGLDYCTPIFIFEHGKCINAEEYRAIYEGGVMDSLRGHHHPLTLVEDNCSIHKSKSMLEYWRTAPVNHRYLPPYSSDLSWVEKTWANMKSIVYEGNKEYESKADLCTAIRHAWAVVMKDDDYRRRLVTHCEVAWKKCLDAQGYVIHWD